MRILRVNRLCKIFLFCAYILITKANTPFLRGRNSQSTRPTYSHPWIFFEIEPLLTAEHDNHRHRFFGNISGDTPPPE